MKKSVLDRLKTKGRLQVPVQTSAGHWITDKEWQQKANPFAAEAEKKREDLDKRILEKRRKGRILKNMALEQ
jgi:hypothetical protein